MSCFMVLPIIATHYGGWVVAPVRAGTDLAGLFAAMLAEVQNPTGSQNNFSSSWLFRCYGLLNGLGLAAWLVIVSQRIGLREWHATGKSEEEEQQEAGEARAADATGEEEDYQQRLCSWFSGLAQSLWCPQEMLPAVVLAILGQAALWGVAMTMGKVAAAMTDPAGCSGDTGAWVFRTALSCSSVLVPLGSIASSFGRCPRWLFYFLSVLQLASAAAICSAALGVARSFWISHAGQLACVACWVLTSGPEGYLVTMAFRYIGDSEDLPIKLRRSASQLLGAGSVVVVCVASLLAGELVESGKIACRAL